MNENIETEHDGAVEEVPPGEGKIKPVQPVPVRIGVFDSLSIGKVTFPLWMCGVAIIAVAILMAYFAFGVMNPPVHLPLYRETDVTKFGWDNTPISAPWGTRISLWWNRKTDSRTVMQQPLTGEYLPNSGRIYSGDGQTVLQQAADGRYYVAPAVTSLPTR